MWPTVLFSCHVNCMNKKEIVVFANTRWSDIQTSFSEHYPFLSLEFQKKGRKGFLRDTVESTSFVNELVPAEDSVIIDVSSHRTVLQVLNDIEIMLCVPMQVSRKSGNVWNIISITEGWTLENQNKAGAFISAQPPISNAKKK
jgi:hypothetical protein